jgi:D-alanyl-D-alanine carboxypeptidase
MSALLRSKSFIPSFALIGFALAILFQPAIDDVLSAHVWFENVKDDQVSEVATNSASPSLQLMTITGTVPVLRDTIDVNQLPKPDLSAKAAIAIDVQSGAVLFQKAADEPQYPASVTKLMTALVARDVYFLDQVLQTSTPRASAGSVISFSKTESQTVRSLLKAALIQSGNDAAEILAAQHPQGEAAFIQAMNDKAAELGLTNTYFENPSGLDAPNQRISARDLARLLWVSLQDDFIRETLSEPRAQIFDLSGTVGRTLYNTNQLLWAEYVLAGKTGTTAMAGQVLTSLVVVNGKEVIISVLGSQDRYVDTVSLYNWLTKTYVWVDPIQTNLLH